MASDESADWQWPLLRTMLRIRRFEEAEFRLSTERAFAACRHETDNW